MAAARPTPFSAARAPLRCVAPRRAPLARAEPPKPDLDAAMAQAMQNPEVRGWG